MRFIEIIISLGWLLAGYLSYVEGRLSIFEGLAIITLVIQSIRIYVLMTIKVNE